MIDALQVSVVLCTHTGGSEWLRECVQSILSSDYERFELIVVDSSPDTFIKKLLEESFADDDRLKHFHIEKKGKSVALNIGVTKAIGELILFTDDDVIVSPQWIRSYVNAFNELKSRDLRIGAMGGPVEGIWSVPRPAWWPPQWLYLTCEWNAGNDLKELDDGSLPFGANMCLPKEAILESGGFDESMGPVALVRKRRVIGEDSLCVLRAKDCGRSIYYVPDAKASHIMRQERLTKMYFLKRMMWEGASQVAIKAKLDPVSTKHQTQKAIDAASRLAGALVRDLVTPVLKGKLNEQSLMSALGLAAWHYGAMRYICGNYFARFLQWTGLAPNDRNLG